MSAGALGSNAERDPLADLGRAHRAGAATPRAMNRLTVGLASLLVLISLASGCVPRRVGPDPVSVGEWCDAYGDAMCVWVHESCTQGAAVPPGEECGRRNATACLEGRPRGQSSGRSYDELNACIDYLEALNCTELGITSTDPAHFMRIDVSGLPPELQQRCSLSMR